MQYTALKTGEILISLSCEIIESGNDHKMYTYEHDTLRVLSRNFERSVKIAENEKIWPMQLFGSVEKYL